jgi:hypothetical protein
MSDKPTDTDTDASTSEVSPPLLFCRSEPVPGDSDDEIREAMEGLGISPFRIDRPTDDEAIEVLEKWRRSSMILAGQPTFSVVNLSALAERIERALRGPINANGDDIDDAPETAGDRRWLAAAYDSGPSKLGMHGRFVKARTEFVLNLIREALGGH